MALGGKKKIIKRVAGPEGGEEEMGVLLFSSANWQNEKADFLTETEVNESLQSYLISN